MYPFHPSSSVSLGIPEGLIAALPAPCLSPVFTVIKLPAVTLFAREIAPRFFAWASPHWDHYSQASGGACGILGGWWPGEPEEPELAGSPLYSVSQQSSGSTHHSISLRVGKWVAKEAPWGPMASQAMEDKDK